jgi:membrane associated rhomboid family serine protease
MAPSQQRTLTDAVEISALAVSGLLVIHLSLAWLHFSPSPFAIVPRTAHGLLGIGFAPLLHAYWGHVLANALPLFVLLILLLADRRYYPYRTLFIIWVASGAGTWLIGRGQSAHLGASGVIFGLAAYLIAAGVWMKNWRAALVAIIVLLLFGSMFYGVLPQTGRISWEGHLCGALAGVWAARQNHQ